MKKNYTSLNKLFDIFEKLDKKYPEEIDYSQISAGFYDLIEFFCESFHEKISEVDTNDDEQIENLLFDLHSELKHHLLPHLNDVEKSCLKLSELMEKS